VKKSIYLLAPALLLATSVSFACELTGAPPAIPDGSTATEAELLAAQDAIKTYMAHSNEYIECLKQEDRQAGDTDTPEKDAERIAAHNAAVDAQEKLAAEFNTQVQAWKAQ